MTYAEKLRDPRWQRKRLEIMERDGWKCRDCGQKNETLNVHHSFYERGGPWETGAQFLLTLCETCHEDRQCAEEAIRRHICVTMAATPLNLLIEYSQHICDGGCLVVSRQKQKRSAK